ncbi:zinc knuckle CX2CX4HX4C containing protein [Tanacetum coccineum]|uniref:Zinc knuckle CX2CX4HX4C containing protein n=1 Tax=Tanacetum coccineum TaxID=301880 RepID=A0ABQ5DRZ7_9ASTR
MEAGFLLGNKSSKKCGLTAKVTNIEGKLLGKDGKPLKSCLKNASLKTNLSKLVGEGCSHSMEAGNKVNSSTDYPKPTIATHVTETIVPTDDTNMKPTNRTLINDEKVVGANVAIPMDVVDEFSDIFANTLYGYFIGERLAFPTVEAYVKNAWEKYGFERAIFRNGFFLFKFSSHDGMVRTYEGGPWFICSVPIFLNIWQVNTKMKREIMSKVPVWVRIHNVPIVAFLKAGLSLITTQLGRPIMLDAYTSDMCLIRGVVVHMHGVNKANLDSLEGMSGLCDDGAKLKKRGKNTAASKPGFRFTKPKNNLVYRPVSKPIAIKEKVSKPNITAPSLKKDVNKAVLQPKESPKVIMDDSYCPVNEHGYYKDDIDVEKLRSTMDKLMDENKVLDINPNTISEGSGETMHSNPNDKGGLTSHVSAPADVNVSVKGSLWDQFKKTHGVSMSKQKSSIMDLDESGVEEVCMPDVLPGGGFLDDVEDDLDCFDGYEDHVYDLPKKARDFCAQYGIRLNSRHRK